MKINHFDLQNQHWDVIVIGTGMGGGTIGYALAKGGKKVLFLERGYSHLDSTREPIMGSFPEEQLKNPTRIENDEKNLLPRAGRYSRHILDITNPQRPSSFIPLIGEGTGGSSALYGAALERFFPEDFVATRHFRDVPGSSQVDWPLSYEDLAAHYQRAEELFQVYGSPDPLRRAFQSDHLRSAPMSPAGQKLFQHWLSKGLHPYRLPVAHRPHSESSCPGCQATRCKAHDKMGSAEACLIPALRHHGAMLLDDCEVLHLKADSEKVTSIECRRGEDRLTFSADQVILAAGALETPRLLLKSKTDIWQNGLGNRSGQVGKNLSRHFMDLYMVGIDPLADGGYFEKELALNDFYFHDGKKLGTIQSLGNPPDTKAVLAEMHAEIWSSGAWWDKLYFHTVKSIGEPVMRSIMRKNLCMAAIMDDVSYEDNQVGLAADGETLTIRYQMRAEGHERLKLFRKLCMESFRPLPVQLHKQGENNQRLAHAAGTCRMGEDRNSSVVNPSNRVHDLENLYIVDTSFFPTGSGINPALTVAANALRVAELMLHRETPKARSSRPENSPTATNDLRAGHDSV